ncbi:MAG: hypothetical protein B6D61_15135 [Bacteroidetes bacterium 4484_249]|nr:MAG: hypothetical protein B6D61_15135 [Bacteroidetes bacterium 4484_249]
MIFTKVIKKIKKLSISYLTVWFILLSIVITIIINQDWKTPYKIFGSDGISYYAYLPVAFIYQDLKMSFYDENDISLRSQFHKYPKKTPTGNWVIPTSLGLALLLSPFFLIAHLVANIAGFEATGYSLPYEIGMIIGAVIYFFIGLYFLRKTLLLYFNEAITSITLISIVIGTNLFYYITIELLMAHAFNFSVIAVYIFMAIKWYSKPDFKKSVILGLLLGLITLLRPTNILVLLVFLLWDVKSYQDLTNRVLFFFKKISCVLFMLISFALLWLPQFFYWKYVTGSFFFWSYGEDAGFFFNNPQILNILFSYRKGWLLYTPIMILTLIGIPLLWKNLKEAFIPILLFTLINIYVISSWWSWWYGCSYSQRPFIDSYAILAIPLATFFSVLRKKTVLIIIPAILITAFFIFINLFQTWQLRHDLLSSISMTKEAYWLNFLKTKSHPQFRNNLRLPDYAAARHGIYYTDNEITDIEKERRIYAKIYTKEDTINYYKQLVTNDVHYYNFIVGKAKKQNKPVEEVLENDATWLYERNNKKINESKVKKINSYKRYILTDTAYLNSVSKKAIERNISKEEMIQREAEWLYFQYLKEKTEKSRFEWIEYLKYSIRHDTNSYNLVKEKARKRNIPVKEMIQKDAVWQYEEKINK